MKNNIWNIKKNYFKKFLSKKFYPETYILQSFFSKEYSKINHSKKKNLKILDIGTLYLNNLLPFDINGNKLYGTEINKETVKLLNQIYKKKYTIKEGNNTSLPFKNNFFDIVLSINTIHYEKDMNSLNQAILEFKRVLKKKGILFIQTVAPNHYFKKTKTKSLGKNIYVCIDKKDIRYGQKFTYFSNYTQLNSKISSHFENFEIGELTEKFSKRTIHSFMIKCENK